MVKSFDKLLIVPKA